MSRTNLGPLTTTFTPPAACTTFAASGGLDSTLQYWLAQSCSSGLPHDAASCWPSASVAPSVPNLYGYGFYSPGLHCPVGYIPACTSAVLSNGLASSITGGTSFSFQFAMSVGETAIGCCPSGMTCDGRNGAQTCRQDRTTGRVPSIVGFCSSSGSAFRTGQSIDVGTAYNTTVSSTVTALSLASVELYAPLFQLVYKATDSGSSTTTSSTSSTSSSSTSNTSTSSPQQDSQQDTGLSTGAKIGIGVGIPLAVLILAAIAAFFFFRRRKMRQQQQTPIAVMPAEKPTGQHGPAEVPAGHGFGDSRKAAPWRAAELNADQSNQRPSELSA